MSYDRWEPPPRPGSRFASRLRLLRLAAGITAAELAERAGFGLCTYQSYETGARPISAAVLMRLAQAMALTPDVFFEPD